MILRCLLILTTSVLVDATTCPHAVNSRIQECVQPVADYAKVLNNQVGTRSFLLIKVLSNFTMEVFTSHSILPIPGFSNIGLRVRQRLLTAQHGRPCLQRVVQVRRVAPRNSEKRIIKSRINLDNVVPPGTIFSSPPESESNVSIALFVQINRQVQQLCSRPSEHLSPPRDHLSH